MVHVRPCHMSDARIPHEYQGPTNDEVYRGCKTCGLGPGAFIHNSIARLHVQAYHEKKESNPKATAAVHKLSISVLSFPVLGQMALGMMEGGFKYGRHNYRAVGVRASTYYDATMGRHMGPWWEGEDIDPASGLNHIFKAMSSLHVLADAILQGNLVDDRPIRAKNQKWLQDANKMVENISARYPNPVESFTQVRADAEAAHVINPHVAKVSGPQSAWPPTCCVCSKTNLSTVEGDGGEECQLSDGRWVCSEKCWDVAVDAAEDARGVVTPSPATPRSRTQWEWEIMIMNQRAEYAWSTHYLDMINDAHAENINFTLKNIK